MQVVVKRQEVEEKARQAMPASASACHESAKPPRLPLQREKGCLLKQQHREPGSTEMHPHPLADTVRVMEALGIANGAG